VAVDKERSVPGDVFLRNGHMAFDWCRRASMVVVREREVSQSRYGRWCREKPGGGK